MHVGKSSILASLLLILLALLTSALSGAFQGTAVNGPPTWEWYVGLFLPLVLFTLVTTYHFLDWAKKHRRQAIMMLVLTFGAALLFGLGASHGPGPEIGSMTGVGLTFMEQSQSVPFSPYSFPELHQGFMKVQEALNNSPYYSLTANTLVAVMALGVLALWLVRSRVPRVTPVALKSSIQEKTRAEARTPREAIIRCYALACQMLLESGMQIADSDTPTDICVNATAKKPLIESNLRSLTSLFQEAKFSLHQVTDQKAVEASARCKEISNQIRSVILE